MRRLFFACFVKKYMLNKDKMLIHVCCAPCSTHVFDLLSKEFDVTGFYYNPNLYPEDEHTKRLDEAKRFCKEMGIELITSSTFDKKEWLEFVKGLENEPEGGARCVKCYEFRLQETAKVAKEKGFEYFTTTLSISPHKKADIINKIGVQIAKEFDLKFYEGDFKKQDGFKKSSELSKKHGLYRQNYCGCEFSI